MQLSRATTLAAFLILQAMAHAHAAGAPPPCAHGPNELPVQDYRAIDAKRHRAQTGEFDFAKLARCLQSGATEQVPALLVRLVDTTPDGVALKLTSVSGKEATLPARVQTLDEAFAPVRDYRFDRFAKRSSDYSATVFLNAADRTRYLLITPDIAWLGRINSAVSGNRWTTIWATATVMGAYSDGYETKREIPFASGGLVRIEIEDDARLIGNARR